MSLSEVRDYDSALQFLMGRVNYERTSHIPYASDGFRLDRMRRLLALVGDPHLGLKAVHIAGTKGKGSTAAMVAAVLSAAGYRTGLYTSPHLTRIEERMAVDGESCSEERLIRLAARLLEAVGRLGEEEVPTFFEITTALAFLHFAESHVDAAVLEVGLGGRLDSTNVCRPDVAIITSISFDHMRQLGNTLAAIASEKAGIIKPGVPVVSGVLADEPRRVIANRSEETGSPLFQRSVDFEFERRLTRLAGGNGSPAWNAMRELVDYREPATGPRLAIDGLEVAMPGGHQAANAACAIAALIRLREQGWAIGDAALRKGLATAQCPARIEVFGTRPVVVLDVAHNPASVAALVEVLQERLPARRKVLVFASSRDKDYESMLRLLLPHFDTIVLTQYIHNPRAMETEQLADVARGLMESAKAPAELHTAATPAEAWFCARRLAGGDDVICITGSFFLAAELRPLVTQSRVEVAGPTAPLVAR